MQNIYAFFGVANDPSTFWVAILFGVLVIFSLFTLGCRVPVKCEVEDGHDVCTMLTPWLMHKLSDFIFSKKMLIACSVLFIAYQVNATLSAYRAACNAKVATFEKIGK